MKHLARARPIAAGLLLALLGFGLARAAAQAGPAGGNAPATKPPPAQPQAADSDSAAEPPPVPGDWPTELLYDIWDSPNSQASEALYAAAFAAGPAVIPELETALKDDRTAEFAAKSLAFIGGNRALEILTQLAGDRRDLGLKRFLYGALAEVDSPQATRVLLDAIARADAEPDRTITEAAILALTVRSDAGLVPRLRELESKVQDPVVRDDLENAAEVIGERARFMARPENQNAAFSLERAVRTYFLPALGAPAAPAPAPAAPAKRPAAAARRAAPADPPVHVRIDQLTFSPDRTRALARVAFEVPSAVAHYDMVLSKQDGNWRLASVWLGEEEETAASQ